MEGGMAILKSDPVDFRANGMTLDKDGHKKKKIESIHQEEIIILNIDAPNNRASKCIKQTLIQLQGAINKCPVTVKDFHAPL